MEFEGEANRNGVYVIIIDGLVKAVKALMHRARD